MSTQKVLNMKNTFSNRLKKLRGKLSQSDFAAKIGTKQTTYSSWERGNKEPSLEVVSQISTLFGVTTDYLLGLTDIPTAVAATGSVNVSGHSNNVANGHGSTVKTCHTADDNAEKLEALTARVKLLELAISQQIK